MKKTILVICMFLVAGFSSAQTDTSINNVKKWEYYKNKYNEREIVDFEECLLYFKPMALQGIPFAQYVMGELYLFGWGVSQDYNVAERWFLKAANQDCTDAQRALSRLYLDGVGVSKDYTKSIYWLKKSAELGDPNSQYDMGVAYSPLGSIFRKTEQDDIESFRWYLKAAMQNHTQAQLCVADIYMKGNSAVQCNVSKALEWLNRAAFLGETAAQFQLGIIYEDGEIVEKNISKALSWYSRAAEQGDGDAQIRMGEIYEQGIGIEANKKEAIKWYTAATRQSADNIRAEAQYQLALIYFNDNDYERAFSLFSKAAQTEYVLPPSYAEIEFFLGYCYDNGFGVQMNIQKCNFMV